MDTVLALVIIAAAGFFVFKVIRKQLSAKNAGSCGCSSGCSSTSSSCCQDSGSDSSCDKLGDRHEN